MNDLVAVDAAAHVFVADVDDERPALAPDDAHHLLRVLRVRRGEKVTIGDGAGRWRECTVTGENDGPLAAVAPVRAESRLVPLITVGFSLIKGERPEWTVQKLTEVGVDRVVPLRARRSVVRWSAEHEAKNLGRLRRIAREAAMQSRRAWLPEVTEVRDVAALVTAGPVALADPSGAAISLDPPTVLVGPEGGWEQEERDGAALVSLGPQVLRAETAALVAGTILCSLRGGVVVPAAR